MNIIMHARRAVEATILLWVLAEEQEKERNVQAHKHLPPVQGAVCPKR